MPTNSRATGKIMNSERRCCKLFGRIMLKSCDFWLKPAVN
jgi:hypothetical protein